jgi:uncharacterized protein YutE (UPF0331/DUF86 family)
VSAKRLKQVPDEYAQCFAILEGAGIIPGDLSGRLQRTAKFRNLLVHMYWKIDYGIVYEILQSSVDDLRSFSRIIAGLL